jgi:hypothetical protein
LLSPFVPNRFRHLFVYFLHPPRFHASAPTFGNLENLRFHFSAFKFR